jgi:putative endonuclease
VMHYVYILYSSSRDKFYKGRTSHLKDRIRQYNSGNQSFTKSGVPWVLVWYTTKSNITEAAVLERKLKRLNRERIKAFIMKYS